MNPLTAQTLCQTGIIVFSILVLLSSFGSFHYGKKYTSQQNDISRQQSEILNRKIDDLKDVLVKQQKQFLIQQFDLQQSTGVLLSPRRGQAKEGYSINFGTNMFINTPNILVVDGIPLLTMAVKDNKLLVSAILYDKDDKILCLIRDNEWVLENNASLRKESTINSLKVWYGDKLILDVEILSDRLIKLNGIFYKKGAEIIATDAGLTIKSSGTGVGIGGG